MLQYDHLEDRRVDSQLPSGQSPSDLSTSSGLPPFREGDSSLPSGGTSVDSHPVH